MKPQLFRIFGQIIFALFTMQVSGATVTATNTGNWSTAAMWSSGAVPAAADSVIIPTGKTITVTGSGSIASVNIQSGGALVINSGFTLNMSQSLTVAGTFTMNGGINFVSGKTFAITSTGTVTWNPADNTAAGATLFRNGVENFAATSTLILNNWYDLAVPLGSVVTGNFGNVNISFTTYSALWSQRNYFATHQIAGTLSVYNCWLALDDAGTYTTTSIGNIVLTGSATYLSIHAWTHPSAVTLNTGNVTITDATMEGVYCGNGSTTINISGNLTVSGRGYFIGVNNEGAVSGVGNGNSTINVTGNITQSGQYSEIMGIYNPFTANAGVCTFTVGGSMNFTGGVFAVHYGCHVGTNTSRFTVTGNLSVTFSFPTDRFYGIGLTTLGASSNQSKYNFKCSGNFSITGNTSAIFISSCSAALETDSITGSFTVSGGNSGFNWASATTYSHPTTIAIGGTYSCSAGTLVFSYFGNTLLQTIGGNVSVSGGATTLKKEASSTTLTVTGSYSQTAGTFTVIGNSATTATTGTTFNQVGNFTVSGGTFDLSSYPGSTAAAGLAILNLQGDFSYTGGTFTQSGGSYARGQVNFLKTGTTQVTGGGTMTGKLDFNIPATSVVNLGTAVLSGSGNFTMSNGAGLMIGSSAGITPSPLLTGSVQVTGTRTYGSNSDYTYNGSTAEVTGSALPATVRNLTIGNTGAGVTLTSGITVTGVLTLTSGKLITGTYEVNCTSTASGAVAGGNSTSYVEGRLRRSTASSGTYLFPIGTTSNYEPGTITFTGSTGVSNVLATFTQALPVTAAYPLTGLTVNTTPIVDMLNYGYWTFSPNSPMTGGSFSISLSEKGATNANTNPQSFCVLQRTNTLSSWASNGTHSNSTQSIAGGTVTALRSALSVLSDFGIGQSSGGSLPIKLIYFTAKPDGDAVNLEWATAAEVNNNFFTIERSVDGEHFEALLTKQGAGNSTENLYYSAVDEHPMEGYSYYRLKQTDFDGHYTYSDIETVKNGDAADEGMNKLEIKSIAPNPFTDSFKLSFMIKSAVLVDFSLMNSSGQFVAQDKIQTEEGINTYEFIDKFNLKKGIYFITLSYNDQKITQKVIKN